MTCRARQASSRIWRQVWIEGAGSHMDAKSSLGAIRNGELTGNVSGRACATGRPTEEIRRSFFHRRAAGVDPLVAAYRVLRLSVAVFLLASPSWLGLSDASRTRSWVWPFAVRVSPIDFARRKIK